MKRPKPGDAEAVTALDRVRGLARPASTLLVVAVLAYGLLLPQLGFYWDELPMSWIRYERGAEAMTRYFSTNRPVWGMLYQLTTALFPHVPIYWQVFALVLRWFSAILVWLIAVNLWPQHRSFALTVALAFLLYPGFNQQWTSYLYSHFFLVLCFLLLSLLCSVLAVTRPRWRLPLTLAAMALSALNLWMMEYFYTLELIRPLLLWRAIANQHPEVARRARAKITIETWWPYALVFGANILWRQFVFNNQIYQPALLDGFREAPLATVAESVRTIGLQFYRTSIQAWSQVLQLPSLVRDGPRTLALYSAVVLATAFVVWLFFAFSRKDSREHRRWIWFPLGLGIAAMFLAGGPFLLTGLEVTLAHPANRFTLPFMFGVSLVLGSLLALVPSSVRVWLTIALMGLAAGRQALWAETYRQDWITQRDLFWQMHWRAPGIAPNTIVLLNEDALTYYADNSLTGAINWIYDPDDRSDALEYVLFYPTSRAGGSLPTLTPGLPVRYDFISEVFSGNTSQVLTFYFEPPGCLRLLRPDLDVANRLIPDASMMREAAALSSERWIGPPASIMPAIYGPEPRHGWCYYFELAEAAAQNRMWDRVTQLGELAFALDDYPNDPVEHFVFIEAYARTENWERAVDLTGTAYHVSREVMRPLLCRLWERLGADPSMPPDAAHHIGEVTSMLTCTRE